MKTINAKRILSMLLALAFMLCVMPTSFPAHAYALEEDVSETETVTPKADTSDEGLCEHHTTHDEECGYKAAVEQAPCTHEHDDACYAAETNCIHAHDEACGYIEEITASPCIYENAGVCTCDAEPTHAESCSYTPSVSGAECTHTHDEVCGYSEGSEEISCSCGLEDHAEGCAYTPVAEAVPCGHAHDEACGYAEAIDEIPCDCGMQTIHDEDCGMNITLPEGHVHDEACGYCEAKDGQPCIHECSEENGCITKAQKCQHEHDDDCGYAEAVEGTPCAYECEVCKESQENDDLKTIEAEDDGISNDEIFAFYIENLFFDNAPSVFGTLGRSRLDSGEQKIYDYMKKEIEKVATGASSSTYFSMSSSDLAGIKIKATSYDQFEAIGDQMALDIWDALRSDCPYDLYWHNKGPGGGLSWGFNGSVYDSNNYTLTNFRMGFHVAKDYGTGAAYTFNTAMVSPAVTAAKNAKSIVSTNASKGDYDKLLAYKNKICADVQYDRNAADNDTYTYDIDPWQLVNVFDGNSSTNVVCEGYAKAFQYLCDLSTFTNKVNCYSVSGSAGGAHMWNIVNINGISYHTDITWIDSGFTSLFLTGCTSGSITNGYYYADARETYIYDDETLSLWGTGSDSILKISASDFDPNTVTKLAAPVLSITYDTTTGKPKLSWNAISGAENYYVQRATSSSGSYTTIKNTTSTSFIDTTAVAGNTYYYRVRGVKGALSPNYCTPVSFTCGLARPTLSITSNASDGKPKLSWNAVPGAENYYVQRATSSSGSYTTIKNTTSTSFIDTTAVAGNTYYYCVRGVKGALSPNYCTPVSFTCGLARPDVQIALSYDVFTGKGKPVIDWYSIVGASGYSIQRATSNEGPFATIDVVDAKTLSFYDDTAASNVTYHYRVQANHSNPEANSDYSLIVSIKPD